MDAREMKRAGAMAGIVAVVGNVAGVAVLGPIPAAYRPDEVAMWVNETMAAPLAASMSGVAFTLGLIALAAWAIVLGRVLASTAAMAGAFVTAAGALLNAAGTLAPLVVAHMLMTACADTDACRAASAGVLGLSLALDALFNLLLGLGLVAFGRAMARAGWPLWIVALTTVAGLASIPVSIQIVSPMGSNLLKIAGPLWLLTIAASSVRLWRDGR